MVGGGLSAGLPVSVTSDLFTLQDPFSEPRDFALTGYGYSFAPLSVALGKGTSYSHLQVGMAVSTSWLGRPIGADASASITGGMSIVLSTEKRKCCD